MNCHVYVDFDGTIMPDDTTDFLLERFALPAWRDVEDEWLGGKIGSRECMARQVAMLRASPQQMAAAIGELEIDPGFASFAANCRDKGIGATIVSDGFDLVIEAVRARHGIEMNYYANRLRPVGADEWRLEFPHSREDCKVGAGHCKCAQMEGAKRLRSIVVGDGRSDFCIAGRADYVLAKGKLLEVCRAERLPHRAFADFFEVTEHLNDWLDGRGQDHATDAVDARAGTIKVS